MSSLPAEIFKAYDIRGIVGRSLTPEIAELIGQAIGSQARALDQKAVCIGRDGRLSGPALSQGLAHGLQAAGVDVIDIGRVAIVLDHQCGGAPDADVGDHWIAYSFFEAKMALTSSRNCACIGSDTYAVRPLPGCMPIAPFSQMST